jgi:hypothetical protein
MIHDIDIDNVLSTLCKESEDFERRFKAAEPAEQNRLDASKARAEHFARKHAAYRAFGELNGWTQAERHFGPNAIGREHETASYNYDQMGRWLGLSSTRFHETGGRKNVAIIGEPYGTFEQHREELDLNAKMFGLCWHVPPMPFASIHDPRIALFIVMTLPDVQ